jgi:hypothetical protein
MSDLFQSLAGALGPSAVGAIAEKLGTNPAAAQTAISAALPMLMGAMAKNSQSEQGANALQNALGSHSGDILGNVMGALGNANHQKTGNGILGHLLGGQQQAAGSGLEQMAGLASGQGGQLLAMLAPMVMGAVSQQSQTQGGGAGALASMLGAATQMGQQRAPAQSGNLLTMLFDKDGDGSIAGEALQMGAGLLGNLFKK